MQVDNDDTTNRPTEATTQPGGKSSSRPKGKTVSKPPATLARDSGKSLLPISRVQKILKADKELPMVAKEATFLISLAAEEFVKRLSEASHHVASREKRVTVQQRDIASVARRADEFLFLEEIIPWPDATDAPARKKPQGTKTAEPPAEGNRTMLDFMKKKAGPEGHGQGADVVVNEDGTMAIVGGDDDDLSDEE
ncbi:histone-fold-containing protein [Gloeopeniophorella convolvens]|nr:histone-fold-containing protein [Gloeopeniophorella convolvens]